VQNPYGREYSNVYEGTQIESPDYKMLFNYLPGLILHYVPGTVFGGDIRWTNLVGIACGLLLFAVCARSQKDEPRGGPHPSQGLAYSCWRRCAERDSFAGRGTAAVAVRQHPVTRAAAVVLFWYHGGQVLVVEQAWPEAWLLVYVGLALWTWRRSTLVPAVALVLALTLKQTAWFCAPFFLALAVKERRWGLIAAVAAGVTAIVLPFLLWNPGAFVQNVVVHFFEIAPRTNALSWSAACLRDAPALFPYAYRLSYVVYAAALACLVLRLRHLRGRDAVLETHVWMTVGLLALFLFLKQSFFNYYYVVGGLLAFTFCLAGRSREAETGAVTGSAPLGVGA